MKILIVGNAYSIHTYNFIKYVLLDIDARDIVIWNLCTDVLGEGENGFLLFYKSNEIRIVKSDTKRQDAFQNLMKGIQEIEKCGEFDVCHLHSLSYMAVTIGLLVRKNCKKLISNYWGSDWLRADDDLRHYQKYLLEASDYVVMDSVQIYKQLDEYYEARFHEKLKYIRFKMPVISAIRSGAVNEDIINRFMERFHIPKNKVVVACGYNGSKEHKHKSIIKAVKEMPLDEQKKLFIIIPMSYGSDNGYVYEIKQELENVKTDFIIIENHLSLTEVAALRLVTDIFINIEPTDAYSSTMMEYSFCNKIVIIGNWLDYSELEQQGAYYEKVGGVEDLTRVLEETINTYKVTQKKYKNNKEAVERFQTDNEKNELWEEIYGEGCSLLQENILFENISDRIEKWVSKNGYQNIGVYGMGMFGGIACQNIINAVGADCVCAFDKNKSNVDWYPDMILKPNQMFHKDMDIVIVTPTNYMKKIKDEYSSILYSKVLTYVEWLDELDKI